MINLSIVIPTKNSTSLLERCLASIPVRSDIEVIVVDDNSDPHIVDFRTYPGLNRLNTHVFFTKENRGAGYARNIGVQQAQGKWLLFADSDDFYVEHAFDILSKYIDDDIDIIYFNVSSVDTITLQPASRNKDFQKYIDLYLTGKDCNGENIRFRKWEPWNKMIRRQFIIDHSIKFDEIPRCNDMIFSLLSSLYSNRFKIINDVVYCVTVNPNSITNSKIDKNTFFYCIICEMKKNYIYKLLKHNTWRSKYIHITICLLKNNGLFRTLCYYFSVLKRHKEIKYNINSFKESLKCNL